MAAIAEEKWREVASWEEISGKDCCFAAGFAANLGAGGRLIALEEVGFVRESCLRRDQSRRSAHRWVACFLGGSLVLPFCGERRDLAAARGGVAGSVEA
uniref:Uncharacterized protein n=1 Tax=Oryza brachyantha TaxID=4533 RepID=J3LTX7_ORYBR